MARKGRSTRGGSRILRARGGVAPPPYLYLGTSAAFDDAVLGLDVIEDLRFGTEAAGGTDQITDLDKLGEYFSPLEGDYDASGAIIGGAGTVTINSEVQNYAASFNPDNHVLEEDGLRLQVTLGAGHYDTYLRGNLTSGALNGLYIAAPNNATPTPTNISEIGLTSGDLAAISVGDLVTGSNLGLMAVEAKNAGAGTITFRAVSSGVKTGYKGNWHLSFTKMAWAPIAADIGFDTTATATFAIPLPAQVVPGMQVRGVQRTAAGNGTPRNRTHAKVVSIASDRLSCVFDRTLNFDHQLTVAGFGGIIFLPEVTAGQIWSKSGYGPGRKGLTVQALRVEFTMPDQPDAPPTAVYTKANVDAYMAAYPGVLFGYWPAVWLYLFRKGMPPGLAIPWSELDMLELFGRPANGPRVWTGNLHNTPYTRTVVPTPVPGAAWLPSSASGYALTPNALNLDMGASYSDGARHSVGVLWTARKVVHYFDDVVVCESDWPITSPAPHQLGLNVAVGTLAAGNGPLLMFPQRDSDVTGQFMTIHQVQSWQSKGRVIE